MELKSRLTGYIQAVEVGDRIDASNACTTSKTTEQEDSAHCHLLSLGEHQIPDYEYRENEYDKVKSDVRYRVAE